MKIDIFYTGSIINLPSSVAELSKSASKEDLIVLLNLSSFRDYFSDFERGLKLLAAKTGLSVDKVKCSLIFWHNTGVLSLDSISELQNSMVTDGNASDSVPSYTGKQIEKFMEENKQMSDLFFNCSSILKKDFNTVDHNNIIFLKNYYKFSNDYILLLFQHCAETDKKSWAYIKKTAENLYDNGIDTYKKLEEHFADRKNYNSMEYKIRKIFGIGEREFAKKESAIISKWIAMNVDIDVIKKAYDITIEKTSKASLIYTAKIIDNWYLSGLKSIEDIEKSEHGRKANASGSSFDTTEFFEAALKRSYGNTKTDKETDI